MISVVLLITPSTTSTTKRTPSTSRDALATSSTKFTCPGVSIKLTRWDLPREVDRTRDIELDFTEIPRDRERICVSVYRICKRAGCQCSGDLIRFVMLYLQAHLHPMSTDGSPVPACPARRFFRDVNVQPPLHSESLKDDPSCPA